MLRSAITLLRCHLSFRRIFSWFSSYRHNRLDCQRQIPELEMVKPRISSRLPPLIFGSATLNYQYNPDPYALQPTQLIERALEHGIRAFDTSPYYGPAETILGDALSTSRISCRYPRKDYFVLTKVGRIAADCFDYSPDWIRHSVKRSCRRLHMEYLDVVYCHDVEFVTSAEVVAAVKELRRIRDEEGTINYVGICGYPVDVLCDLAEQILRETGEPLDIVQSYANFTLQNTRLRSNGLRRFIAAGVDVVTNASPLGMGLLRRNGPPTGAMGDFHPAPDGLRQACATVSAWIEERGDKIEKVAFRYAVENWMQDGKLVGTCGSFSSHSTDFPGPERTGVNVMGVSTLSELEETMLVWKSILDAAKGLPSDTEPLDGRKPSPIVADHEWNVQRRQRVIDLARDIRTLLGVWADFTWDSPEKGFVRHPHTRTEAKHSGEQSSIALRGLQSIMTPPPSDTDNA